MAVWLAAVIDASTQGSANILPASYNDQTLASVSTGKHLEFCLTLSAGFMLFVVLRFVDLVAISPNLELKHSGLLSIPFIEAVLRAPLTSACWLAVLAPHATLRE